MKKGLSKIMAIMVVSLFCVTAFVAVVLDDDSSASSTVTHKMYIEIIGGDALVDSTQWIAFESNDTPADFAEKATAAAEKYGLADFKITYSGEGDYLTVSYGNDPATSGNVACFYVKDGAWTAANKTAQEYPSAEIVGFAVGGWISKAVYDALTDANKAKYDNTVGFDDTWYARKILDAKVTDAPSIVTYHYFLELFDDKGKVEKSKWVTFDSLQTATSVVVDANQAFKDAGWEKATLKLKPDKSAISMVYEGGTGNNASAYVKDDKWEHVTDTLDQYVNYTTVCLAYEGYISSAIYDTLSDSDKENWIFDFEWKGTSYYYTKVTEPVNGWEKKDNNLVLYIVIGVVAVVAIAAIAFFLMKKKA